MHKSRRSKPAAAASVAISILLTLSGAAGAQPDAVKRATVGNVTLHYIERGQGEPVILLHGGQGDYRSWPSLIDALASKFRVISYSRRHHWPNENALDGNHSALVDGEDLAGLIAALKLEKVHLVGTSYGAFTALAFAVRHADRVASMVLAEPPVLQWIARNPGGAELYRRRVTDVHTPAADAFAAGRDADAMRLFIDTFDGRGTFDALPAERRAAIMANARFFKAISVSSDPFPDLPADQVRRLTMPVLIVRGEETDELHAAVTEQVSRVLSHAERVVIPNAGHGSPRQNPAAFNAAVAGFLARHAAGNHR